MHFANDGICSNVHRPWNLKFDEIFFFRLFIQWNDPILITIPKKSTEFTWIMALYFEPFFHWKTYHTQWGINNQICSFLTTWSIFFALFFSVDLSIYFHFLSIFNSFILFTWKLVFSIPLLQFQLPFQPWFKPFYILLNCNWYLVRSIYWKIRWVPIYSRVGI